MAATTALAVFAFSQRSDARDQARVAKGGQLVASALSQLGGDPELALALGVEAARVDPTPQAEDALRDALAASRERAIVDVGDPLVSLELDRTGSRALVVGADGVARLIDLRDGHEAWSHPVDGAAAAFAPRDRSVHVVQDRSLVTLDAETGAPIGEPKRLRVPGAVERLVVSPDGATAIVIAGKPRARVVALATGSVVGRVKQSTEVTAAAFAPSGRLVASGGADRTARLWDTRTWEQTQVLRGHVGRVLTVSFDRSGQRVGTGSTDQTARIWRSRTGVLDTLLYGHTGYVRDVSFGADGHMVTASGDGTARTWGANGRPLQTLRGHRGAVTAAVFSADGAVVTAGADGTIRIWDPGTSVELRPTRSAGPPDPSTTARSSTGAVATAVGSAVRLRTAKTVRVLRGHQDVVNSVSFSPDGRLLVTAGRDHDVIVWDVASGEPVHRFAEAHSASVADGRFSADGRWIVTAGPISARLWNVEDGNRSVTCTARSRRSRRSRSDPIRERSSRRKRTGRCGATSPALRADRRADGPCAVAAPRHGAHAHSGRARPLPRLTDTTDTGLGGGECRPRASPGVPPRYVAGQVPLTWVDADAPCASVAVTSIATGPE